MTKTNWQVHLTPQERIEIDGFNRQIKSLEPSKVDQERLEILRFKRTKIVNRACQRAKYAQRQR